MVGDARSEKLVLRLPGTMCSNPRAKCTVHKGGLDSIVGIEERGAASRIVVDICNWDPGHAEVIEGALDERRLVMTTGSG